jgi:hypothetical protein
MSRADVIELAGIVCGALGGAALGVGLYLLALWLVLIVGGIAALLLGGTMVYIANRGSA